MRIVKTMLVGAGVVLIDLRAAGSSGNTGYNRVGYLKVALFKSGSTDTPIFVKPVVTAEGVAPVLPTLAASLVTGTAIDWLQLATDGIKEAVFGEVFGPGYTPAAQGDPQATHLAVGNQGSTPCVIAIIAE